MSEDHLHKGAKEKLFGFARENRSGQTVAENLLWQNLRNRKLSGIKFRRQHPIADFVADFYCHESKLIIEIDGGYHSRLEQADYDKGRTYQLLDHGLKVLRFSNEEVEKDISQVLRIIKEHLIAPHP